MKTTRKNKKLRIVLLLVATSRCFPFGCCLNQFPSWAWADPLARSHPLLPLHPTSVPGTDDKTTFSPSSFLLSWPMPKDHALSRRRPYWLRIWPNAHNLCGAHRKKRRKIRRNESPYAGNNKNCYYSPPRLSILPLLCAMILLDFYSINTTISSRDNTTILYLSVFCDSCSID